MSQSQSETKDNDPKLGKGNKPTKEMKSALDRYNAEEIANMSETLIRVLCTQPYKIEHEVKIKEETTSRNYTLSASATQMNEDCLLVGRSNWNTWKFKFRNMMKAHKQWDEDDYEEFGKPAEELGAHYVEKNVKEKHLLAIIHRSESACESWEILTAELEKKTVTTKVMAITDLINHKPNEKSNMKKVFDHHEDVKTNLENAFGTDYIKITELADLVFMNAVKGYDGVTALFERDNELNFYEFREKIENLYEKRVERGEFGPKSNNTRTEDRGTEKCQKNSGKHFAEGKCRACEPCKKCTSEGVRWNYHVENKRNCEQAREYMKKNQENDKPKSGATTGTKEEFGLDKLILGLKRYQEKINTTKDEPKSGRTTATENEFTFTADSGNTHTLVNNNKYFDCYYDSK
jgi:hypothetical protein